VIVLTVAGLRRVLKTHVVYRRFAPQNALERKVMQG
jgi:hypothetical protein